MMVSTQILNNTETCTAFHPTDAIQQSKQIYLFLCSILKNLAPTNLIVSQ